jgi:predicted thioesterase
MASAVAGQDNSRHTGPSVLPGKGFGIDVRLDHVEGRLADIHVLNESLTAYTYRLGKAEGAGWI